MHYHTRLYLNLHSASAQRHAQVYLEVKVSIMGAMYLAATTTRPPRPLALGRAPLYGHVAPRANAE
jgi:hypothetical protein